MVTELTNVDRAWIDAFNGGYLFAINADHCVDDG